MRRVALFIAQLGACILGGLGLERLVVAHLSTEVLPAWASTTIAGALSVVAWFGVAEACSGQRLSRSAPAPWVRATWLVMLPLAVAAVPVEGPLATALGLGGAFVALVVFRSRGASKPTRWFDVASLVVVAWGCALLLATGAATEQLADNDGAYYFGVARHIVTTGRFEEPIVWHFVDPPPQLVHPPFDCWGPMTVMVLLLPLFVFGATPSTAILTMTVVSCLTLVAFWYLVTVALRLRHFASRFAAVVLFTLAPVGAVYRSQPESPVLVHLLVLSSLIVFARRRFVTASVLAALLVVTRSDGIFLAVVVGVLVGVAAFRRSPRDGARVVLALTVCLASYLGWSLVSFGTLSPPAVGAFPFLSDYALIYHYGAVIDRTPEVLLARIDWGSLAGRAGVAIEGLRRNTFVIGQDAWLLLGTAGGLNAQGGPTRPLIWLLFFVSYPLHVWLSGVTFATWRAPVGYLPLLVLVGAMALDRLLTMVAGWGRLRSPLVRGLTRSATVFALAMPFLFSARFVGHRDEPAREDQRRFFEGVDGLVQGSPIGSNFPWQAIAFTRSPAVSLPANGLDALAAIVERYRVPFIAVYGEPPSQLKEPFDRAKESGRFEQGALTLELVSAQNGGALFRVVLR